MVKQLTKVLDESAARAAGGHGHGPARRAPAGLKRMISGASLALGGTLVWQASNFAFNAVGAHALGPARYGVFAASMALLGFTSPLLAAVQAAASREATSLAARKELAKARPMLRHYGLRVTCVALVLGGAVAMASGWISGVFRLDSAWLVVIIGATIPCYVVSHLFGGLLQGAERFGRFALESIVEGSAKAILGILAMGLLWRTAFSGVLTVTVSSALGLMTYLFLTLPVLHRSALSTTAGKSAATTTAQGLDAAEQYTSGKRSGVARYSMTAFVTYGLLAVMLSSDTLVAKHYFTNHQAGLYAGISLSGKIAYFASSSIFVVAFPIFSRQHDQGAGNWKGVLATGGLVCAIAGSTVALFALKPAWVVIPLLGGRYQAAEGYVPWMAAVFGLYALAFLVAIYLLARKRRSIIALLAVGLVMQFAGFFAFHSTITSMMAVLALSFGAVLAGGLLLVPLGGRGQTGTPGGKTSRRALPAPRRARDPCTELVPARQTDISGAIS
jgi:O-antigen/teichoic acid export membrane protein